jgi:hypothetical protein
LVENVLGSVIHQRVHANEVQVLEGELFPLATGARVNYTNRVVNNVHAHDQNEKHQPKPDHYENDLIEQIDAEDTLYDVGVNCSDLANEYFAEGDPRENRHPRPAPLGHKRPNKIESEQIELAVADQAVQKEELSKYAEQVEALGNEVHDGEEVLGQRSLACAAGTGAIGGLYFI